MNDYLWQQKVEISQRKKVRQNKKWWPWYRSTFIIVCRMVDSSCYTDHQNRQRSSKKELMIKDRLSRDPVWAQPRRIQRKRTRHGLYWFNSKDKRRLQQCPGIEEIKESIQRRLSSNSLNVVWQSKILTKNACWELVGSTERGEYEKMTF